MSRRKQSRPQHLDHDVKDMPGADFSVTENRLKLAVNSVDPEIKFEGKEKVNNFDMTQGESPEGEGILKSDLPSGSNDAVVTGVEKMATPDELIRVECSKSPLEDEECTVPYASRGKHSNSNCHEMPKDRNKLPLHRRDAIDSSENVKSGTPEKECFLDDSECVRPENSIEKEQRSNEAGIESSLANKSLCQRPTLPVYPATRVERKHECEKCGVSFHGRDTYEVHVKHYCSGKTQDFTCHLCGAKFDSKMRLMIHSNVHVPQSVCLLCSERMSDNDCEKHLIFHLEDVEKKADGTVVCPACSSSFNDKSALPSHFRMHHTVSENAIPLLSNAPLVLTTAYDPKTMNCTGGTSKSDGGNSSDRNNEATTSSVNLSESGLDCTSPRRKTSSPFKPPLSVEYATKKTSAFSCIVCGLGLPDVIALQRHLLTTHTATSSKQKSLSSVPNEENVPQKKTGRPSLRKVSTVSPPRLSLLATPANGKPGGRCSDSETNSGREQIFSAQYSKKRKEGINATESGGDDDLLTKHNTLKRVRRDTQYAIPNDNEAKVMGNTSRENRRVSCPVVSNRIPESEKVVKSNSPFPTHPDTGRYCVQCDIKFSSAGNFRAHKQFYCASRHMQKLREGFQSERQDDRQYVSDCPNEREGLYLKSRKRNVGNKSSMTPRKRSHLIPLETVRSSPPTDDDSEIPKPSSIRKSCPSHFGAMDRSSRPPSGDNPSPVGVPKKHLCQECNIWFSKYDTYIAHKKYYCESRRKDRAAVRTAQSSIRNHSKRRSDSTPHDPLFQPDNSLSLPNQSGWSSRGSSPSTEAEEERQTTRKNTECGNNFQSRVNSYGAQFPFYGQVDQEMLARLSLMQPLILNQYIAMLRERMGQTLPNNSILLPSSPFLGLSSFRNDFPVSRTRKLSADETQFMGTCDGDGQSAFRNNNRPSRQSCVAVINVKHETDGLDENIVSTTPINDLPLDREGLSPLDLSQKDSKLSNVANSRPASGDAAVLPRKSPFPTIDLSKTALPIIKREPQAEFPVRDTLVHESPDMNERPQINQVSPPPVAGPPNQQESQVTQVKHCKNCDARFTSLSTFIAHKKYYCTAAATAGLVRNDVKPVQLAH